MSRFLLFVLAFSCLVTTGCAFNASPGSGEKIGQIVKLNKQGLIWKTWEAELIRGGLSGGSGTAGGAAFDFTIADEALAKKAEEFMNAQTEVIIKYEMPVVYMTFTSDSDGHFVKSIEPAVKK